MNYFVLGAKLKKTLAHLGFEGTNFEDHLHREQDGEDDVQHVGQMSDVIRLITVLRDEKKQ